jgi:hypothetical protein
MNFTPGDVSGLQALTPADHLYEKHINELRESLPATAVVGRTPNCPYYCDGIADEVEINQAMSDVSGAGGGTIHIQPGTYTISDRLVVPSNISLIGSGKGVTIIKAVDQYNPTVGPSSGRSMVVSNSSDISTPVINVLITGITFDGNVQNITGLVSNANHRLVDFWYGQNIKFIGNEILRGINWSVFFRSTKYLWIENNTVLGGYSSTYNQNDGIHVRGCQEFFIRGNYVDTNVGGGTSGDDAIAVVNGAEDIQDTLHGIVANNICSSGSRGIVIVQEGNHNIRGITVADNVIWYTYYSGMMVQMIGTGSGKIFEVSLDNNKIYNYGNVASDSDGIRVQQITGSSRIVFKYLNITNNTIRNGHVTTGAGISVLTKGVGLKVDGNNLTDLISLVGIQIGGTSSQPVIDYTANNNLIDISTGASNAIGMLLEGTQRGTVVGNSIKGHTTGTTYGIMLQANNTAGNDADGVANAETSAYNNVSFNSIYNFDNGVAEFNGGAAPDNNQFIGNQFNSVTTKTVLLGSNSSQLNGSGSKVGIGTSTPGSKLSVVGLPTSASGLSTGDLWIDTAASNVIKIV